MTILLAQADSALETAKAVGGLPTSAVLALAVIALGWLYLRTDTKLDKALAANDELDKARLQDLKDTFKDLGGKEH